ncbi:uncharacterized protein LOC115437442 [Sphaeramia orbicularis]|uniref:uncharacterized protein LOC115437442 n=1 Tax=Sphaeramia orbicularis TaxID=375764 RepID=UPI00117FD751|nr:uncharacterized protein LOC115437442 [Sphaeramia orbicularis]
MVQTERDEVGQSSCEDLFFVCGAATEHVSAVKLREGLITSTPPPPQTVHSIMAQTHCCYSETSTHPHRRRTSESLSPVKKQIIHSLITQFSISLFIIYLHQDEEEEVEEERPFYPHKCTELRSDHNGVPGLPRPPSRFPSPSRDALGHRSPSAGLRFGGSGPHGGSPRGLPAFSPGSPCYSPGPVRGYRSCSPGGFRDSPPGFGGGGGRGFGGHTRRRGDEFRRPQPFSPTSGPRAQAGSSDSVEKYFSPSMLQDPWNDLTPMSAEAVKRKHS